MRKWTTLGLALLGLAAPVGPVHAQLRQAPPRATVVELEDLRRQFESRPDDAEIALRYARALAAKGEIRTRRAAVRVLLEALRHQPTAVDLRIALADLYYRQGYLTLSRQQLQTAIEQAPDTGPAYSRLGRMALRDWLKFQRPEALDVAARYWQESARRAPDDPEPWLGLGVLALIRDKPDLTENYARQCLRAVGRGEAAPHPGLFPQGSHGASAERAYAAPDPRGEGWLMLGAAAYRQGKLALADSAFQTALRFVSPAARAHLLDITPAASDEDTVRFSALRFDSGEQSEFVRRFWRSRDPDLVTAVNEVQLEFLARGALAYFLYFDQRKQKWDERGALLVRYGVPEEVYYNPPWVSQGLTTNLLVWRYPSLGMTILLEDRYLNENYDLPISLHRSVDPLPDPERLATAAADGRVAVAGRGVFSAARPGVRRLEGEMRTALFRRVRGFDPGSGMARGREVGRLELYLAVDGPRDPIAVQAEAVVFDSTWREVARARARPQSHCNDDTVQVMQFNFDLPEGPYTVGVSAQDAGLQAVGSWRQPARVVRPLPGRLEISDLELACAFLADTTGGPFDKPTYAIVPNPKHELRRGAGLGVYFEIYGLVPGESGLSEVAVEYTVRSMREDKRPFFVKWINPRGGAAQVQAVRTDETPGRVRFQYVSTELKEAEPGSYRLEVRVEDRRTGQVAERRIDFSVVP